MASPRSHFQHSPVSVGDGDGGDGDIGPRYTRSQRAAVKAYDRFYSWFPAFLDMFPDEDAFLEFAFYFILTTILGVIIASRYIKIRPSTYF